MIGQLKATDAPLSAQPSPGGQDALATARELLAAEYDKAGERVFADRARKGRYDNDPDVRAIVAALAARQQSKQPDSVALGEATEFCIEKGDRRPAHGSGTLVDSGALQMALNVLRRAGKDEVADALEATAARQPVEFDDKELQFYREHIGNDLDNMLIDAGVFEVTHEGGYKACWANSMDALERLIDRQPVGEPVTVEAVATVRRNGDGDRYIDWLTEGGIADLDVGDVLMVSDRAITDEDGSGELYTAPPAQSADLPYSLDADPVGIRARVADVITGTLMVGAQGHTPPPAGHWAEPFWQAARADATAQAVDLGPEPMFYIQDTRQFVGNCPVWWAPNGGGYVTRLDEAGRYTEQEAVKQNRTRDTDVPWPCAEIDAIARHTVDFQHMRPRAERLAELALIDSQAVGNG